MNTKTSAAKVKPLRQVMQSELEALIDVRARVDSLSHQLKEAEKEVEVRENSVIERLDKGISVEDGLFYTIVEMTTRLVIPWKELYVKLAGPQAVEDAQATTEPRQYRKLKVLTRTDGAGGS